MGDNEKKEEVVKDELNTVEKLTWATLLALLIAQYGFGIMAEPVPEKFIYALGAVALGLNQLKGR